MQPLSTQAQQARKTDTSSMHYSDIAFRQLYINVEAIIAIHITLSSLTAMTVTA
ncbi:hypothetical protein [Psychrobacter sp.]|uniref:hypothetical protein n=1 Tax=Psychrobacter sp. TaxID=56811 RepID=UPI0026480148|nr:hypothetical protein [Psychrobacter sp.]MDN6276670.1 hypothetical protein [Psychrobacter sp.]MDN6308748.1 hypothetical protein [Psychrobacter sp.]